MRETGGVSMQSQNGNVVIKDVPYGLWFFGVLFGGIAVWMGLSTGAPSFVPILFGGAAILMVLLIPVLTVTVDRNSGVLVLRRSGIIIRNQREIRIDQIDDIYVSKHVSSDEDGTSVTYKVNIVLDSGEEIPLRRYSSSGYKKKAARAQLLRDAIGLADRPDPGQFNVRTPQDLQQSFQADQLAAAGISEGEQETDGVRWELQTRVFGNAAVTRWFTAEVETPGYFVYITQKQEGQGSQKGLMNMMGKTLFKQSLKMYGFDDSYTPGVESAVVFQEGDRRLMEDYFVFASTTSDAHRIFNPWVITPLVAWADRHPLNRTGQQYSQMTVLFSPWGMFVSVLGSLNAQEVEEITSLGVELAKSATP
jgi:hypothetical protein